ncbi:MAG: hypothetical protein OXU22_00430 [Gammaproteobacteria bacterium]|nr:hypothetical protein [Gammaproteobacteria bacterium]
MKPVRLKRCDADFQIGYCDAVPAQAAPGGLLLTWWILSEREYDEAYSQHRLVFECHQPTGWPMAIVCGQGLERYPPGASWRLLPWDISDDALGALETCPCIRLDFKAGRCLPVGGGVLKADWPLVAGETMTGDGEIAKEVNGACSEMENPNYNYCTERGFFADDFREQLTALAVRRGARC